MKRCPECFEVYDEGEKFCEMDGQRLLPDPALTLDKERDWSRRPATPTTQPWVMGLIGVTAGILLCGALYTIHTLWSSDAGAQDQTFAQDSRGTQAAVQSAPPRPRPSSNSTQDLLEDEAETAEAEAEASPDSSPDQSAIPESQQVAAHLNQGPISTGPKVDESFKNRAKTKTIIVMTDGSTVEVDAAWEDKQGVWYRRAGLVSFVDSHLVKVITARAEPISSSPGDKAP